MTEQEARDFLRHTPASDLLKRYSTTDISILIQRAGRHISPKIPENAPMVIHHVQTSFPVIKSEVKKPKVYNAPSIVEQAKNLGHAVVDWAKGGFHMVPDDVFWKRIAICRACPWWQEIAGPMIGRCKKCGCSSAKHRLATSRCPLNPPKWEAHLNR